MMTRMMMIEYAFDVLLEDVIVYDEDVGTKYTTIIFFKQTNKPKKKSQT